MEAKHVIRGMHVSVKFADGKGEHGAVNIAKHASQEGGHTIATQIFRGRNNDFENCLNFYKALHHKKNSRREFSNPAISNPLKMN